MCSFNWSDDYIHDNITGLKEKVSGQFVDVLDKLRQIIKHTNSLPSLVDACGDNVDGIRILALYLGLKARSRNSRKSLALQKMVDVAQTEIQPTREALDNAGLAFLDKLTAEAGIFFVVLRRISGTGTNSSTKKNWLFDRYAGVSAINSFGDG